MNSHNFDSQRSFGKKSAIATPKEVQGRESCKRFITAPSNGSKANSFLVSVKLHLDNLIIEKYSYDLCNTTSAFRNIVQVTRFIVMKGRNTIMGTCTGNKIFLAYRAEEKNKFIETINPIRQKLRTTYSIVLVREGFEEDAAAAMVSYLVNFTLVCRLLESGKWIHYGDNMETLIESQFMEFEENDYNKFNKNKNTYNNNKNDNQSVQNENGNDKSKKSFFIHCMGFNVKIESYSVKKSNRKEHSQTYIVQLYIRLFVHFFKMLPITEKEAEINMYVYCLPRCAVPGSLCSIVNAKFDKRFNYRDYWFDVHGYVLTKSAVQKIANVHLYVQDFNYPLGTVLREVPMKIMKPMEKKHMYHILNMLQKCPFLTNTYFDSIVFFLPKKEVNNRFSEGVSKNGQETSTCGEEIPFPVIYNWNYVSDISNETFKEEIQKMYACIFSENTKTQNKEEDHLIRMRTDKEMIDKNDQAEKRKTHSINVIQKTKNDLGETKKTDNINVYSSYGNIISNSRGEQSINLNFSTGINQSNRGTVNNPKKTNTNIDDFLKETALTYKLNTMGKETRTYVEDTEHKALYEVLSEKKALVENNDKQNKTMEIMTEPDKQVNNKNKETGVKIDRFLSEITEKHKTMNNGTANKIGEHTEKETKHQDNGYNSFDDADDFFGGINEQVLFSKDFQEFLKNIEDDTDMSTVCNNVRTVNYNQREQKRPNFKIKKQNLNVSLNQEQTLKTRELQNTENEELNIREPLCSMGRNLEQSHNLSSETNKRKSLFSPNNQSSKKWKEDNSLEHAPK